MRHLIRRARKRIILALVASGANIPITFIDKYRELVYLKQLIDAESIGIVLDVGANTGQFADDLRLIGFKGKIISFEPVKTEFDKMKYSFRKDSMWEGHQFALGSKSETRMINVSDESTMSSLLESDKWVSVERREEIEVKRLDDVFENLVNQGPDDKILLKTDTQGFDLEVFHGASGCIDKIHSIMAEISVLPLYNGMTNYKEALLIYENEGFRLFNMTVVSRNREMEIMEMNCLMKRP